MPYDYSNYGEDPKNIAALSMRRKPTPVQSGGSNGSGISDLLIPALSIVETIVSKGKSPGTSTWGIYNAQKQNDILESQGQEQARMNALDTQLKGGQIAKLKRDTYEADQEKARLEALSKYFQESNDAQLEEGLKKHDVGGLIKLLTQKATADAQGRAMAGKMTAEEESKIRAEERASIRKQEEERRASERKLQEETMKTEKETTASQNKLATNPLVYGLVDSTRKFSDADINTINDATTAHNKVLKSLADMESFYRANGNSVPIAGELGTKYTGLHQKLLLDMKKAEGLGVLSASDMIIVNKILPPAGVSGRLKSAIGYTDFSSAINQIRSNATNGFRSTVDPYGIKTKVFESPEEAQNSGLPAGTEVIVGGRRYSID